ncbi:MAG: AAA family ATPase, partial [Desulfosarcina sp.]|nr:AAA family ATPase [Desulfobacterales bacterium]
MKFPYGIADFKGLITEGYFYCDRTDKIPLIENTKSQLFIRPRRFGKSLVLSMLENYYDVAKKDEFETIFGGLKIGKNPTELRNSYFILKFDFSCVDPTGSAENVKKALFNHINGCIEDFYAFYKYKGYELPQIKVNFDDAIYSLKSLASSVRLTPYPVYLLIDEYDNFANTVMMGVQSAGKRYEAIVHDEGPLRTFFKAVKASTSGSMFDRVFITGVSPVVMSDITSGYNIAKNIYFEPEFNDLCGFKRNEIENVLKEIVDKCSFEKEKIQEAVNLMQTYYNGYTFSHATDEHIYNPTLCLYFVEHFEKRCSYPRKMLDSNLAMDESKLEYIAQIPRGRDLLMNLVQKDREVVISDIEDRFGVKEMLTDKSKGNTFLASFLYYFGVLTIAGDSEDLEVILKVPNLVMNSLYVERIQKMLLPEPEDRDDGRDAAKLVYKKGEMAPLCRFMEERYFKVFHNRDYRWANELTVKTAFLTLL